MMNEEDKREKKIQLLGDSLNLAEKALKRVEVLLVSDDIPAKDVMGIFKTALAAAKDLGDQVKAEREGDKEEKEEKKLSKDYSPVVSQLVNQMKKKGNG